MTTTRRRPYDRDLPIVTANLTLVPTRTTQGTHAATQAIRRAQTFAGLVRDEGPDSIGAFLDNLTGDEHYALTVTLAAMLPIDHTPADLLDWIPS